MKKVLVVLTIMILATDSLSALDCGLSLGYQDKQVNWYQYEPIYASIDVWQDIGNFRVYAIYLNEMRPIADSWMFLPVQDYFTVGIAYTLEAFTIRVEHMCQHAVVYKNSYTIGSGGYSKIEINIGGTAK